jgi:hypothetical protein
MAVVVGEHGELHTRADGRFVISGLPKGTFTVVAESPGLPPRETPGVATGTRNLRLQLLSPATLGGVVTDQANAPIEDYTLAVTASDPTPGSIASLMREMALAFGSDSPLHVRAPDGKFARGQLAPGTYLVTAETADGRVGRAAATLRAGESKLDLRIALAPGVTIRGRVVDAATRTPVAQTSVMIEGTGDPKAVRTDPDGGFAIGDVYPEPNLHLIILTDGKTYQPDDRYLNLDRGLPIVDMGEVRIAPPRTPRADGDVGVFAINYDGRCFVDQAWAGSPAARAGVEPGDALLEIDGVDVSDLGGGAISALLAGRAGTEVALTLRAGHSGLTRKVILVRAPRPCPQSPSASANSRVSMSTTAWISGPQLPDSNCP